MAKAMDRSKYAGLAAADAALVLMDDYAAMRKIKPSTKKEKTAIFRRILGDLAEKGHDLGSVDQPTLAAYRAYLADMVEKDLMADNYAYALVKDWNAMTSLVLGDKSRPSEEEGLKMKGFLQVPKVGDHLEVEEVDSMIEATKDKPFKSEWNRRAAVRYLEVSMCTGGRWDSIGHQSTTFASANHLDGTMKFQKVKNAEEVEPILTKRCMEALKADEAWLRREGRDPGPIPLMEGEDGRMITYQTTLAWLKDLAARAKIKKHITTHVLRKSLGNHMGLRNPKLGAKQLGITQKVYDRSYFQPTTADRAQRRDLILGGTPVFAERDAKIGALYRQLHAGEISQQEFDREVNRGLLTDANMPPNRIIDPAFG